MQTQAYARANPRVSIRHVSREINLPYGGMEWFVKLEKKKII